MCGSTAERSSLQTAALRCGALRVVTASAATRVEADWDQHVVPALDADELARYTRFKEVLDAMTPSEPHWYLGLLGTRPDKQRTGVGRGLLEPMLSRAERESLPVFLETGAQGNIDFYAQFGFEQIAEDTVPNGPVVWGLLKRAR